MACLAATSEGHGIIAILESNTHSLLKCQPSVVVRKILLSSTIFVKWVLWTMNVSRDSIIFLDFRRISSIAQYVGGGCCNIGTPSPPCLAGNSSEIRFVKISLFRNVYCIRPVVLKYCAQHDEWLGNWEIRNEYTRLRKIWVYHILQQPSWLISKNSDSTYKKYVWPNCLYYFRYLSMNTICPAGRIGENIENVQLTDLYTVYVYTSILVV